MLKFYLQKYHCSQCNRGPFLYPGPFGGVKECPGCSHPVDASVKKLRGDQINVAEVEKWWKGLVLYCPYCGSQNDPKTDNCTQCSGPMQGATHPDVSKVSPMMKKMLLEVGINLDAAVVEALQVDGWGDDHSALQAEDTPPIPTVVPAVIADTDYKPQPATTYPRMSFQWLRSVLIGLAGVTVVGLLITFLVIALTPHKETLKVSGFYGQLVSGYSYPTVVTGECYINDDNCPTSYMTPVATQVVDVRDEGEVAIATIVTTVQPDEVVSEQINEGEIDEGCEAESTDLDGVEVVMSCTATPEYIRMTATPYEEVEHVMATHTSYPRTLLKYTKIETIYDVVPGLVFTDRNMPLVFPSIPVNTTPEPQNNAQSYWVTFEVVGNPQLTRKLDVTYAEWLWFTNIGQTFVDADVTNLGMIYDLIPGQPDPAK